MDHTELQIQIYVSITIIKKKKQFVYLPFPAKKHSQNSLNSPLNKLNNLK
jgi:hypothetical protein